MLPVVDAYAVIAIVVLDIVSVSRAGNERHLWAGLVQNPATGIRNPPTS